MQKMGLIARRKMPDVSGRTTEEIARCIKGPAAPNAIEES